MTLAVGALAGWFGAGCRKVETPSVESAVAGFFRAAATRDCLGAKNAATGRLLRELEETGCDAVFENLEKNAVAYQATTKATADGRAADARIVEVRIALHGKTRDRLMRVEHARDGWRLAGL